MLFRSPEGAKLFDKMLKESCPYHQGPVKHTLEECVMLRRHFHRAGPPVEGGRARDDDKKEDHCRCFGSDRTPGVAPQVVFRSSTVSTTVAKWFVPIARGTVDRVYRFGPLRDV